MNLSTDRKHQVATNKKKSSRPTNGKGQIHHPVHIFQYDTLCSMDQINRWKHIKKIQNDVFTYTIFYIGSLKCTLWI